MVHWHLQSGLTGDPPGAVTFRVTTSGRSSGFPNLCLPGGDYIGTATQIELGTGRPSGPDMAGTTQR